mmetsp:Transcript_38533/g.75284  ORF Transcript_38533/g.75284 Transcript_38533/m.75284 type:complete len:200 (-) Transcript_38533:159-758(-)
MDNRRVARCCPGELCVHSRRVCRWPLELEVRVEVVGDGVAPSRVAEQVHRVNQPVIFDLVDPKAVPLKRSEVDGALLNVLGCPPPAALLWRGCVRAGPKMGRVGWALCVVDLVQSTPSGVGARRARGQAPSRPPFRLPLVVGRAAVCRAAECCGGAGGSGVGGAVGRHGVVCRALLLVLDSSWFDNSVLSSKACGVGVE